MSHTNNVMIKIHRSLLPYHTPGVIEIGVDEAGRGCLAGDVYAAAVVLPEGFQNPQLNDSKQLTEHSRNTLRRIIEREAVAWAVGVVTVREIEEINILNAAILAMHRAIEQIEREHPDLKIGHIIVDGNRFKPYTDIPHTTIVKGDARYMSIAAASVLAKTHRDEYMLRLHAEHPQYGWDENKGYPTARHRAAIEQYGITNLHRKTFHLPDTRQKLDF